MQVIFNPLKSIPNVNRYQDNSNKNKTYLQTKPDVVSFSARDFLSLPEDVIFERIIKSVNNPENLIGTGSSAEVYKIENTSYCVRIPYDEETKKDEYYMINCCSDFNLNVLDKDKVNHVVARLGGGATIMKKINGSPVLDIKTNAEGAIKSAIKVSKLPLSAYCDLLHQIADAYKQDMVFDAYGTNVIADTQNLVAIDFNKMNPRYKEPLKPLISMYESLVCVSEVPTKVENTIIKKILKAALKEVEPGQKPCVELDELDTLDFISWIYRFKKIDEEQFENLWDSFNDVRNYKSVELAGLNSEPVLARKIAETSKLVDEIF